MEFRTGSKELKFDGKKARELELFRERAIRRVDSSYTYHVIQSGNAY